MDFKMRSDRIWLEDEGGRELAFVSLRAAPDGAVEIISTVVDGSLRGQGVAGALLEAVARQLRSRGRRAVPVCSYAVEWFARHPEQGDLLKNRPGPSDKEVTE